MGISTFGDDTKKDILKYLVEGSSFENGKLHVCVPIAYDHVMFNNCPFALVMLK
jgi:hypothetical protein